MPSLGLLRPQSLLYLCQSQLWLREVEMSGLIAAKHCKDCLSFGAEVYRDQGGVSGGLLKTLLFLLIIYWLRMYLVPQVA